jgi:trehalose 6-phosphate phosphatase
VAASPIRTLPHALRDHDTFIAALAGRRPTVFLDYDGVLTPIVDRPEDARMTDDMRRVVRDLAGRAPVCVVSGRDRAVVQDLMGVDDLVVAGSHGFDIWHPERGTLEHEAAHGHDELVEDVLRRLRTDLDGVDGVALEVKRVSVAVHYRRADEQGRERAQAAVRRLLAENPDRLKVTPGKMIDEVQPKIDWNKGRAVEYLLDTLGLAGPEYVPLYLGDDVTDEDAFRALRGRGIGVYVGDAARLDRETAADFTVASPDEVRILLDGLAR